MFRTLRMYIYIYIYRSSVRLVVSVPSSPSSSCVCPFVPSSVPLLSFVLCPCVQSCPVLSVVTVVVLRPSVRPIVRPVSFVRPLSVRPVVVRPLSRPSRPSRPSHRPSKYHLHVLDVYIIFQFYIWLILHAQS